VSNRIINEVRGINRVVYDVSGKPPLGKHERPIHNTLTASRSTALRRATARRAIYCCP